MECDHCLRSYCLCCSGRESRPVDAHPGDLCREVAQGGLGNVYLHYLYIANNLLNLHCPRCHKVVFDWSGCCAVTCEGGHCGANFCGFCLTDFPDSGSCHQHVLMCGLNPKRGDYFATANELNLVHRGVRIAAVRKYFKDVVKDQEIIKRIVAKHISIFSDLKIFETDLL